MSEDAAFQPEAEMTIDCMGVATGMDFADALGSVSLLGRTASPLLLVSDSNKKNLEATEANLTNLIHPYVKEMKKGYIIGGSKVVSPAIEELLNAAVQ